MTSDTRDASAGRSFLAGRGEMAGMIRARDWSEHPFGPVETWPQSLRSALSICLNSAFPTAIYWGPELRLLYNDAWAPIPGPRHPASLGAPASEVWADIWHVIEPQFAELMRTGEGIFVENQMLPMRRFGAPEETYWSYSFSAIRGEAGGIAGIFNSGSETTRTILEQRKLALAVTITETLRHAENLRSGRREAIASVAESFRLDRIVIASRSGAGWTAETDWAVPPLAAFAPSGAGEEALARVGVVAGDGHGFAIDDVEADAPGPLGATLARAGMRAAAAFELTGADPQAKMALVATREPRHWSRFEIGTLRSLLEHLELVVWRELAEERERLLARELDHRARNILTVVRAIMRLTTAETIEIYREKLDARIEALANAHQLILEERWQPVPFGKLLHALLAPFAAEGDQRLTLDGPEVFVDPPVAQTLSLVIHELGTNATKYGALATADGRLDVAWSLLPDNRFALVWTERGAGGGSTGVPRPGHGFGSRLLAAAIEGQLGGTLERRPVEGGLVYRFEFDLDTVSERERPLVPKLAPDSAVRATIMIVEDEPVVAMDYESLLIDAGFGIAAVASSVEEAFQALDAVRPDLVILDGDLKGAPSAPVATRLAREGIPFVFVTGGELPDDFASTGEPAAVLRKPVADGRLLSLVGGALPQRPG